MTKQRFRYQQGLQKTFTSANFFISSWPKANATSSTISFRVFLAARLSFWVGFSSDKRLSGFSLLQSLLQNQKSSHTFEILDCKEWRRAS